MRIEKSRRLQRLSPYFFIEINRIKQELRERGEKIISLGVGDPDIPTPQPIIEVMKKALENRLYHRYSLGKGLGKFREAVAIWYKKRFQVELNSDKEVHVLVGSKEGIGHLPLGLANPHDIVLVPEPGYPVYWRATVLAGGNPYFLPLGKENNFLPVLDRVPEKVWDGARLLYLNYPNNPTAALATKEFYQRVIELARKYNFVVASDLTYSEIYYQEPPISFLSLPGAKEVGVEFHSLSKTFNMTGWRIGWICGNEEVVKILSEVKDNYDSGIFSAIQEAGVFALLEGEMLAEENRKIWKGRRDFFFSGLKEIGFSPLPCEATFYLWSATPPGISSEVAVKRILSEARLVVTPGTRFGPSGEGYLRFALTANLEVLNEALERLKKIKW